MNKWIAASLLMSCCSAGVAEDTNHFVDTDVFELEVATDTRISPNGKRVAYVRQSMDIMTDNARSNIWIVDIDGDNHRPLLSGTASYSSPRWSPQGDRLAYISSVEGRGPELYVRWMDTGQTALVSNLETSPASIAWSPDGNYIAFSAFVKGEGTTLAKSPKPPKGADWAPNVVVIDSLNYRRDGRGILDPGNAHVFVIPADGGTPRQLTTGDYNHRGRLAWSPDGTRVVLSANRNEDWEYTRDSDLWSIDVATGEMTQLTTREGPDAEPAFSSDGSKLAYLGYDDQRLGYHSVNVYVMDMNDGEVMELTTEFDRQVAEVFWAGDSNRLLYIRYDDHGKRHIASLNMKGTVTDITDDVGGVGLGRPYTSGNFSVAQNGAIAYSGGSPYRPADVMTRTRSGNRRLTRLNDDLLGHRDLASVEEMVWPSSLGDYEIQGWLVKPPGFDPARQYPLILEIHGGPFAAYGPHFAAEIQLYAAAGYVVLYANPRGSTSYGMAFANEIHHNYPGQDYNDLMSGVDAVIDRGFIDKDQLFVTGGSGGGVLTAWIVGKTGRFAAAAIQKPVINWTSHALYSDIPIGVSRYWFANPPWEDYESYWRRSPLSLVGNVTTPTMLVTGEADQRTPIAESEQYYEALKLRKIDSVLVRIPEASHGIASRPSNLIAKVDNILAWFEKYRTDTEAH